MATSAGRRSLPERAPGMDRGTHVFEQLRELIVWGRIAPGTRIIEAEVANRLNVSRTPVRAALQRQCCAGGNSAQTAGQSVGRSRGR